ncbi:MAG: DNA repair protein RecN [Candidatus Omnitrophica bacterium]|nr:DNA repair protein RecN [Candidatus Omnitrophota bacterium]
MLARLHIENFALIDDVTLEFIRDLNILTGETGAGKSILIDALRFVMGERSDAEYVRDSKKSCLVEAVFEPAKEFLKKPSFSEYFEDGDSLLILRRDLSWQGRSRGWVNGRTVNISTLRELGKYLMDIHGQYDHQMLLDPATHLPVLDGLWPSARPLQEYRTLYEEFSSLLRRRDELLSLQQGRERELDLLKFQIEEIKNAGISDPEEDLKLESERVRFAHSEKIREKTVRILNLLEEGEGSASSNAGEASRYFQDLSRIDSSLEPLKAGFETARLELEEFIRSLRDYLEKLDADPERLEEIQSRLSDLNRIKKKYGPTLAEAGSFYEKTKKRFDDLTHSGVYEKETERKISSLLPQIQTAGRVLTDARKKAAQNLRKGIEKELLDLGMTHAEFRMDFSPADFGPLGQDAAEFMISLNAGEPAQALAKIISGGEASRVMLALKKTLMKADPVPTLIFDEIDANIGGRLGTVVGNKLKEITQSHQVFVITHLPQIASFGERHIKVFKTIKDKRTFAQYRVIEGEERVKELAQMMSGKSETDISRRHAEEMLEKVKK